MKGFFPESQMCGDSKPIPGRPRCGTCGLHKTCGSPKILPKGKNKKGILIIGEAPGTHEDLRKAQDVSESEQFLRKSLKRAGVCLDRDCLKTTVVRCLPPGNGALTKDAIDACFPALWKTIQKTKPKIILLLGSCATGTVIRKTWREEFGGLERWAGWTIPSQSPNAWICPTYHPAFLIRKNNLILDSMFDRHLKAAIEKSAERPWAEVPDFRKDVEIVLGPAATARIIEEMMETSEIAAFDFETNMLKPDDKRAEIVSCSICFDGERTIAFPWHGAAIEAAARFLKSGIKKIAANMKFEDRWTRAKLGFSVRRMFWDTMQAAHVLDNRPSIAGLKFLSYVHLGMPSYDSSIAPYFKSGPSGMNKVREVDLHDLLLYNGLDSLLTYKIAMMQMDEFRPFPLPRIGV